MSNNFDTISELEKRKWLEFWFNIIYLNIVVYKK
jgi:hypothetical protein